eukprot:1762647-Heterocapsa_arctica.AAC.1
MDTAEAIAGAYAHQDIANPPLRPMPKKRPTPPVAVEVTAGNVYLTGMGAEDGEVPKAVFLDIIHEMSTDGTAQVDWRTS